MKVEISIPESLSEITLEQYQRFMTLDPNSDNDFLARKMLDIFCGVKDILKVRKKDVDRVSNKLGEVFKQPTPLVRHFDLNGKTFGFQPDLENITFGEFIDLDNTLEWPNIHRAMNVLFRPVLNKRGELYTIEDYKGTTAYDLKKMPLSVVLGALVFFWTLSSNLSHASLQSFKSQVIDQTSPQEGSTLKSGAGTRQLIDSLMETLQNKKRLHDYQLANAFIHSHSLLREIESKPKS